jgi:CBS domain-containing protein
MEHRFRTIGDIIITNTLSAMEDSTAFAVATKLLLSSFPVMPVLDHSGKVIGKVTEMDLLKGVKTGRNLKRTWVKEIMALAPPVISTETTLEATIEIIETYGLTQLPVTKNGRFIGSVTRHDLLRACLGVWVDHERGSYTEVIG